MVNQPFPGTVWIQFPRFTPSGCFGPKYTVVTPDESRVVGCVYIYPTRKRGFDAEVYLWARQSELAAGLEQRLHTTVKEWIARDWPLRAVAFPGRDIGWEAWRALAED